MKVRIFASTLILACGFQRPPSIRRITHRLTIRNYHTMISHMTQEHFIESGTRLPISFSSFHVAFIWFFYMILSCFCSIHWCIDAIDREIARQGIRLDGRTWSIPLWPCCRWPQWSDVMACHVMKFLREIIKWHFHNNGERRVIKFIARWKIARVNA